MPLIYCFRNHSFPFPEPKRKYNMSYDGTEKEPAKRIKIKRSLVIFPFCRLLILLYSARLQTLAQ